MREAGQIPIAVYKNSEKRFAPPIQPLAVKASVFISVKKTVVGALGFAAPRSSCSSKGKVSHSNFFFFFNDWVTSWLPDPFRSLFYIAEISFYKALQTKVTTVGR